jgi:anti-sigma factor RsiW
MHEQPNPSDHPQHDLLVIAAFADRGATGEEADLARAQIATCTECAALHADLVSLATATRQLPPIERPRDFRLRPVDAQRLRPNLIRRLFGSFGTPRDGFSRPLAAGLTTLGLAGLMLGILPGTLSLGSSGAATSAPMDQFEAAASAPAAGAPAGEAPVPGPDGAQPTNRLEAHFSGGDQAAADNARPIGVGELQGEGPGPIAIAGQPEAFSTVAEDTTGVSQLVVISGTLLIVGLGLFALRWTSRRFGG